MKYPINAVCAVCGKKYISPGAFKNHTMKCEGKMNFFKINVKKYQEYQEFCNCPSDFCSCNLCNNEYADDCPCKGTGNIGLIKK